MITVEIIFLANDNNCFQQSLCLPKTSTVSDAIKQSQLLSEFPSLNLETLSIGVFSNRVTLDTVLQAGDRIEIYRPLSIDPKTARRLRAKQQR